MLNYEGMNGWMEDVEVEREKWREKGGRKEMMKASLWLLAKR